MTTKNARVFAARLRQDADDCHYRRVDHRERQGDFGWCDALATVRR